MDLASPSHLLALKLAEEELASNATNQKEAGVWAKLHGLDGKPGTSMSWVRKSPGVVTKRVESADPSKRWPLIHCVRPVVSVLCNKVPGCTWGEFQA